MTASPLRSAALAAALLAALGSAAHASGTGKPSANGRPAPEAATRADHASVPLSQTKPQKRADYSAIIHSPFGAVERNFESGRR